jgi:hypothetical protein
VCWAGGDCVSQTVSPQLQQLVKETGDRAAAAAVVSEQELETRMKRSAGDVVRRVGCCAVRRGVTRVAGQADGARAARLIPRQLPGPSAAGLPHAAHSCRPRLPGRMLTVLPCPQAMLDSTRKIFSQIHTTLEKALDQARAACHLPAAWLSRLPAERGGRGGTARQGRLDR